MDNCASSRLELFRQTHGFHVGDTSVFSVRFSFQEIYLGVCVCSCTKPLWINIKNKYFISTLCKFYSKLTKYNTVAESQKDHNLNGKTELIIIRLWIKRDYGQLVGHCSLHCFVITFTPGRIVLHIATKCISLCISLLTRQKQANLFIPSLTRSDLYCKMLSSMTLTLQVDFTANTLRQKMQAL